MEENRKKLILYNIARRVALVSVICAAILSVLLIVNYIQTETTDPLNSEALNRLMLELRQNPADETLKEQIRALDLLARRAYFLTLWQIRVGGFLLFFFVLTFLISLKYTSSLSARLPDLSAEYAPKTAWENKLRARRYLIFSGIGLFLVAALAGVLSEDVLKDAGTGVAGQPPLTQAFPGIGEIRDNWPNFRGPEGIGIGYHTDVPTDWDGASGRNVLWKIEIPLPGYNSPILWGKKLFLSGAEDHEQVVYCIDADTGTILWEAMLNDIPGSPEELPENTEDTGLAAPTMATDGACVYVLFGTGDVACLDMEGERLWAKNLGVPENHYGHSSSLIVWQDLLLVQYDQNSGGRLIALETKTGVIRYDQPRDTEISWASPILVNTGNRDELMLNASPNVMSHDPATGRELWRADCMSGEVAPSLAYANGIVFAVNEYALLAAIEPGAEPKILWDSMDDLSEVSSPVATDNYVFVATSYGTVSCYDSKTGERYWFEDLPKGFYSSPVLAGENVYLMDMDGTMYIFKAANEYSLVNTCELGEKAVTVPAFMHGRIYIRGFEHLYCIGE